MNNFKRFAYLFIGLIILTVATSSFNEKGSGGNSIKLTINSKAPSSVVARDGEIKLEISGGTAPYQIRLMGPELNHKYLNNNALELKNLKKGDYLVIVKDKNGKIKHQEIQL